MYLPWAVRTGARAKPLMSVWYERSFERPLAEMRRELRVTPAPPMEEWVKKRMNVQVD